MNLFDLLVEAAAKIKGVPKAGQVGTSPMLTPDSDSQVIFSLF